MDTAVLETRQKDLKQELEGTAKNIEETKDRLKKAKATLVTLNSQHEGSRKKRQQKLAMGEGAEKISATIKQIVEKRDLKEDEVLGLEKRLGELQAEENELTNKTTDVARDILKSKLIPLVGVYNKKAQDLAAIVKEIWDLRNNLRETNGGQQTVISPMGWEDNALFLVPKLFATGEEYNHRDRPANVFFDYMYYRLIRNKRS